MVCTENNTRLLCQERYYWMADLLFHRFGFYEYTFVANFNTGNALESKQITKRSTIQCLLAEDFGVSRAFRGIECILRGNSMQLEPLLKLAHGAILSLM